MPVSRLSPVSSGDLRRTDDDVDAERCSLSRLGIGEGAEAQKPVGGGWRKLI
jgi:hypothetical protein